jgi:DNA-binding MarR family transcriptional regulator
MTTQSTIYLAHRVNQIAGEAWERAAIEVGSDITPTQAMVLDAISAAEEKPTQTELVHAVHVDRSTMADVIKRLEKKGLIKRKRKKGDVRAYEVSLTSEGRTAVGRCRKIQAAAEAALACRVNGLGLLAIVNRI